MIAQANPDGLYRKEEMVVIPLRLENKAGLSRDGYQVVPILCYHRFAKQCQSNMCVPESVFEQQLQYLKDNDYQVITLSELAQFLAYDRALPPKSVILTIDDGYRSIYEIAYPLLQKYGFTATLFVYTDFIGASATALTWEQLRELKAAGFEIGSHSLTHSDLTLQRPGENDAQYVARLTKELEESKRIIDKQLDQDTAFFAYPYSNYDHRVLRLTEAAGYTLGLTVKNGTNPFYVNPFVLYRNQVLQYSLEYFVSRIDTFEELALK